MRLLTTILCFSFIFIFTVLPASAGKKENAAALVANAADTVRTFTSDSRHTGLLQNAANAKAIVVIPSSVRAGFLFGASGGNAAIIAKRNGRWSNPSFLRIGSVSFGLQAGGDVSEIILLVMTERGKEQLLSTSVKLGADLSISAATEGVGGKAQTTDILAYSRSKGLYGSISLEGAILKTHHKWNKAYYGRSVTPIDIIAFQNVANPQAAPLVNAVRSLTSRGGS